LFRASGAKHRVGFKAYQYSFSLQSFAAFFIFGFLAAKHTHSAEQQLMRF